MAQHAEFIAGTTLNELLVYMKAWWDLQASLSQHSFASKYVERYFSSAQGVAWVQCKKKNKDDRGQQRLRLPSPKHTNDL